MNNSELESANAIVSNAFVGVIGECGECGQIGIFDLLSQGGLVNDTE